MISAQQITARIDKDFARYTEILSSLVRIPSISSSSYDLTPLHESAKTVAGLFAERGFETEILSASGPNGWQGRPAVIARKHVSSEAPTVLLYAHHDVQPAGDLSAWQGEPFEPEIRDGRLYGRGSSDDKAGILVHLASVSALGDELGVNVTVFIEGEEEVGSPSFQQFVAQNQSKLAADLIIVTDSDNWQVGHPAITTSLRGVVQLTVQLKVLDHAVHSGMFGGPILDANTLAARLIATLHDEQGDVAVAGLVASPEADVEYPEENLRQEVGAVPGLQLAGTGDLAARMWTKPAISVIGMDVTSVAEASNTIASGCRFVLSMRVAPGQSSEAAKAALEQHLRSHAPFGAQLTIEEGECGPAYQADLSTSAIADLRWALKESWGIDPVDIGVGGSIPFISQFQEMFPSAAVLVTGVEDPQTNAHSENESQDLSDLRHAMIAEALLLARTAGQL